MGDRELMIKADGITKNFRINLEHNDTFKKIFLNMFRRGEYRHFRALDSVSFEIKRGEFIGIIGRNGSGKSTLLKVVSEIYLPDEGEIRTFGKIIPFLELGVGFNPELTARENVYLNGIILGLTQKEVKQRFDEIVDFAEIRAFLDTPVKNFSSGMYVRLAFAIAMQIDADIYILDEVLSVGDAAFQEKSIKRLEQLLDNGATVIFVSHSMEQIKKYCQKTMYLEAGKMKMFGPTEEVVAQYLKDLNLQGS